MAGSFSSINTALTALQYNRVAMDVAGSNIANVDTEGYARRRVTAEAVGGPDRPAMWSRYDGVGDGVRVAGVARMTDPLLDARARTEHGNQAYLDVRQTVLERVESGLAEPGPNGVSAAMDDLRSAWQDLANNPDNDAIRLAVLGKAAALVDALRLQSRSVDNEMGDLRFKVLSDVSEVNTLAKDLAATNKSIAVANLNGTDAGVLLDRRDQMALRLAELTGATATQRPDGGFDVSINGVSLVSGDTAAQLEIATGITPTGASDGQPVTYQITGTSGTTAVPAGMTGDLGGLTELLTTTLPAFRAGIGAVAQQLADQLNAQHALGYDKTGAVGGALFGYNPADPGGSLTLAITDPDRVAASSVSGVNRDSGNAEALAGASTAGTAWQQLINGFGTQVASARRLAANQQALTGQIDGAREQLAGISLDEEMVSMLQSQRAYEAASRLMTTLDSVLDTLINRTGLVR